MKYTLKYIFLACSCILFATFLHGQHIDSTRFWKVKDLQETVKKEYAPDKRTCILAFRHADIATNTYVIETTEKSAKEVLESKLHGLEAHVSVILLPDTSVGVKTHGIVRLSVANMRTFPDHSAELASQALMGTQVDLLQKKDGEYRVRTPDGYIAWMPTSAVAAMDGVELQNWKKGKKLIYTNEFGKSYSEPSESSQRVSDLVYGDLLLLSGQKGNFYEVLYPDARKAFIKKQEGVTFEKWLDTRNPTAGNIISSAKSMLGLPYLWGGTSVKGVDCSGFTKTTYFMNGFIIPRDASQQVLAGEKIDILNSEGSFDPEKALKNLKPADLLFFAAGKNSSPTARVTHVALYIGDGKFIQAAGLVRINSMLKDDADYDDFQTRTVVAARRYLGVNDPLIKKIAQDTSYISR